MSHNGSVVTIGEYDTLVISLESNPSTGYRWEITEETNNFLGPTAKVESEYEAQSDLVGASGIEIFRIHPCCPGATFPIKLVYHRPFEEGVDPLEVFSIDMRVE
jgi:inhibitor of cysteine peptidase